jgi:two-component system alkaline phosphatase synthesis response regulator PhoP
MERRKILVVDDDEDIVESIQFNLEQEGYDVTSASNGWEALGAVRVTEPDLVILDVMLPKENGYRASRCIKDDIAKGVYSKNIVILLLTARVLNDPEREEMFMNVSQADYMMYKPFDMSHLIEKVEELLSN